MSSWSEYVEQASAIFIRAPKYSKSTFVGGKKSPFSRDDPRLRSIPFSTRRPTLKEVRVVHSKLAALYVQKSHDPVQRSHDYSSTSHDSWSQTQDSVSSKWLLDEQFQSDFNRADSEDQASAMPQLVSRVAFTEQNESTSVVECVEQSRGGGDGGSRGGGDGGSKGKNKKKKQKGDKQKAEEVIVEPVPGLCSYADHTVPDSKGLDI